MSTGSELDLQVVSKVQQVTCVRGTRKLYISVSDINYIAKLYPVNAI